MLRKSTFPYLSLQIVMNTQTLRQPRMFKNSRVLIWVNTEESLWHPYKDIHVFSEQGCNGIWNQFYSYQTPITAVYLFMTLLCSLRLMLLRSIFCVLWRGRQLKTVMTVHSSHAVSETEYRVESTWTNLVEWYLKGKTEEFQEKPFIVPICPSQIPHGLAGDRTRASSETDQRLMVWVSQGTACVMSTGKQLSTLPRKDRLNLNTKAIRSFQT